MGVERIKADMRDFAIREIGCLACRLAGAASGGLNDGR